MGHAFLATTSIIIFETDHCKDIEESILVLVFGRKYSMAENTLDLMGQNAQHQETVKKTFMQKIKYIIFIF